MKSNFSLGMDYAVSGVKEFYKHPFLWKYVIVPFVILIAVYSVSFYYTCEYIQPYCIQKITDWFANGWFDFMIKPLESIISFTSWLLVFIILALISNGIFECVGALFFPFMVKEYEKKVLKINSPVIPFKQAFHNFIEMILFTCFVLFLFLLLSLLIFFFPVVGFLIFLAILGYQYSIIFMSDACFNSGSRLSDIKYVFMNKKGMMYGFGCFSFFILQIPFCSLFFYPGFVIGGVKMYHEENEIS